MRRSWLALIVVVLIIGGAVLISTRLKPPATEPTEGPAPSTATVPSTTAPPTTATTPSTAAPSTATRVGTATPSTATAVPEPPKPEPPDAKVLLDDAERLVAARKPLEAIQALSRAMAHSPKPADAKAIATRLTKLVDEVLFSRRPCPPLSVTHEVVSGDSLWRIARKHHTTIGLVKRLNGLKSDAIRVGQRLKIIPGGFDVEVVKSQFRLTVTKDGLWIRQFKVGLGKDGATPVGEYMAGHSITEPPYTAVYPPIPFEDHKNNPLGTRWVTIQGAGKGQYGIHGTWEPDSIGKERSKGCIRMLNDDVEWLFDLLVPGHSKIVIRP